MANRARDWLLQAERDLEHAVSSQRAGHHEWACFAAHQATEKAAKALHLRHGQESWGQVVAKLLRQLPPAAGVPPELIDKAKVLDNFYVTSRYPNSHHEGAPLEHYGELQSNQAIDYAREILEFARPQVA